MAEALARTALAKGQEVAGYAADVLAKTVLHEGQRAEPAIARRLAAELELKQRAVAAARRFVRDWK